MKSVANELYFPKGVAMDLAAHSELMVSLRATSADAIVDGPIVASRYQVVRPRIMWVLREAHGDLKDYCEFVDKHMLFYQHWRRTLGIVAKVSEGIIQGCLPFKLLTNNPSTLQERLRDVAIVNVNKEAGARRISWKTFISAAGKYAPAVVRQIEFLDPHIVLFAGTFDVMKRAFRESFSDFPESIRPGLLFKGRLYVQAEHPNQRRITHSKYYEDVRANVQDLLTGIGRTELEEFIAMVGAKR